MSCLLYLVVLSTCVKADALAMTCLSFGDNTLSVFPLVVVSISEAGNLASSTLLDWVVVYFFFLSPVSIPEVKENKNNFQYRVLSNLSNNILVNPLSKQVL